MMGIAFRYGHVCLKRLQDEEGVEGSPGQGTSAIKLLEMRTFYASEYICMDGTEVKDDGWDERPAGRGRHAIPVGSMMCAFRSLSVYNNASNNRLLTLLERLMSLLSCKLELILR